MTIDMDTRAAKRIADMVEHVNEIGWTFGHESPTYMTTMTSLHRALGQTFTLLSEGASLSADGDLGLYIVTSYGMHVGVVFFAHPDYRDSRIGNVTAHACTRHDRPIPPDAKRCDPGHDWCLPAIVPVPGTWSLHS